MRLHILADLHLEFGPVVVPTTEADVVVLGGDIHLGSKGLEWAKSHFGDKPMIYVLGNHEFYRHALPELTERLEDETRALSSGLERLSLLEVAGCGRVAQAN